MSESWVTIAGEIREKTGKGNARKLRKEGKIPANLLEKGKAQSIQLVPKLLEKAKANNEGKFYLELNGEKKSVKIHEFCLDIIRRQPKHVDLIII